MLDHVRPLQHDHADPVRLVRLPFDVAYTVEVHLQVAGETVITRNLSEECP